MKRSLFTTKEHKVPSPYLQLGVQVFLPLNRPSSVAVFSCFPGEGVSTVCRSLSEFLVVDTGIPTKVQSVEDFTTSLTHQQTAKQSLNPSTDEAPQQKSDPVPGQVTLIDCSPLFDSLATLRVMSHAEAALLVVRDGQRSKAEIDRAIRMVQATPTVLAGVILNGFRDPLPHWLSSQLV